MDSPSSASVMAGTVIFLTITELPDSEATTSLALNRLLAKSRRTASATAPPSMMAPSTMLSGGTDSTPMAETRNPLPTDFSSIALTELDPMSRPTRLFGRRNSTFTCLRAYQMANRIPNCSALLIHIFGPEYRNWRFRFGWRRRSHLQNCRPLTVFVLRFCQGEQPGPLPARFVIKDRRKGWTA